MSHMPDTPARELAALCRTIAGACCWLLIAGCSKNTTTMDYGQLSCLDGWPSASPQQVTAASLTAPPAILWKTMLTAGVFPTQPGVALSGDTVVASAGPSLFVLDRKSGSILNHATSPDPPNYQLGSPSVDTSGIAYVESAVASYAFGSDTKLRWTFALAGRSTSPEPTSGQYTPSIAGGSAILGLSPGYEQAFDLRGNQLWIASSLQAARGAGHWGLGYDGTASFVLDMRTGHAAGRLQTPDKHDVISLVPIAGKGIIAADAVTPGRFVLLDTCGNQTWSATVPAGGCGIQGHVVVGPGEVVYFPTGSCSSSGIAAIDSAGQLVAGPVVRNEVPWLVGADGTLYAADLYDRNGLPQTRIVALSTSLSELWHLDIDGALGSNSNAAMTDDGILYTQTSNGVVAIQTTSPGLATSSWPTFRHDNGATNWGGGQY